MNEEIIHVSDEWPVISPDEFESEKKYIKDFCKRQAMKLGMTIKDSDCESCKIVAFDDWENINLDGLDAEYLKRLSIWRHN